MGSLGSIKHDTGDCKPCLFYNSKNSKTGCQNGIMCHFCHLSHNRKNKPRPCKGKRERYRKLIQRMESLNCDPNTLKGNSALISSVDSNNTDSKLDSKMTMKADSPRAMRSMGTSIHQNSSTSKRFKLSL